MNAIQRFIFIILMILLSASVSQADEKVASGTLPAPSIAIKDKFPVTLQAGDYDLVGTIFDFAPGAGVPLHMHGGNLLVLVLSGELTLSDHGTVKIMKQGASWTEAPGNEHSVINNGTENARIAVSIILPKGNEATTIIKK